MSEQRTRIDIEGHVATVTLTRPEKHNALDMAMFESLAAAADAVGATPGVRSVVLHGDGPSFCSGIDVGWLAASQADGSDPFSALASAPPNVFQRAAYAWVECPVPVIAAIQGNCLGGGLQVALGADIRFAAPDAKLSVMETRWGLIPDMAITRTLFRLVPIDVARELIYTARVLSGTEAHALGLVTHLSEDPLTEARALATKIATKSPDAIRRAKALVDTAWTGDAETTLAREAALQSELMFTPNQMAAVSAGVTRQPAQFTDPESDSEPRIRSR